MLFARLLPGGKEKKAVDGLKRKGVKHEHNGKQQGGQENKVLSQQNESKTY